MNISELIQNGVQGLTSFGLGILTPTLISVFLVGVIARMLVYYHLSREEQFSKEFEKRVDGFLNKTDPTTSHAFFGTVKRLLLITFYEMFEKRALLQRRKLDPIMVWSDRVFLTKQGFALLVKDTLTSIRYLKYNGTEPKLLTVSKGVFEKNPCFTRVFGIIPSGLTNDILNILPGMFVIGGIFGTFLGIMNALPELGGMNLKDYEGTKMVMDLFLLKIAHAMGASVIGIALSVMMSFVNAAYSPHKTFVRTVERFENCLQLLWNRCESNLVSANDLTFDEHKNPLEALAEQALAQEHIKATKRWFDDPRTKTDDKKVG